MFNHALNTFHLQLYSVRYIVTDHSDSERGNPLPPHGLLFQLAARVILYAPSYRIEHTTAFVTPVVEHWNDPSRHERTLLPRSYISLLVFKSQKYKQTFVIIIIIIIIVIIIIIEITIINIHTQNNNKKYSYCGKYGRPGL